MIFILQNPGQPEPSNTQLNGFCAGERDFEFQATGFVVDGDFMGKCQYYLIHHIWKESKRDRKIYSQYFSLEDLQYRGVPCEKDPFDSKEISLKVRRYYLSRFSGEYLFFHDYYHDGNKPNHQNSMEKEMTSWAKDEGLTVKYWGACGNRAYFQRWVYPNEEEIPELGQGMRKAVETAEHVFTILLSHRKQVVIG